MHRKPKSLAIYQDIPEILILCCGENPLNNNNIGLLLCLSKNRKSAKDEELLPAFTLVISAK